MAAHAYQGLWRAVVMAIPAVLFGVVAPTVPRQCAAASIRTANLIGALSSESATRTDAMDFRFTVIMSSSIVDF